MGRNRVSHLFVTDDAKQLLQMLCDDDGVLRYRPRTRDFVVGDSCLMTEAFERWSQALNELLEMGLVECVRPALMFRVTLAGAKAMLMYRAQHSRLVDRLTSFTA